MNRLGSVRQVINSSGSVVNFYTYEPFGKCFASECTENTENPFKFTGQYFDAETGEYYLRARQYNPTIARFTATDPVFGKLEQPLTLHKYLYCCNDPVNATDFTGRATVHLMLSGMFSMGFSAIAQYGIVIDDEGNIGTIKTHNDPRMTDRAAPMGTFPEDMDEWGFGYGTPAISFGGAIGFTTADTMFDLEGPGISVGGSIGLGFGVGVDYIRGIQRNGEYYHGIEFTPQWTQSMGGLESHGHRTYTTVTRWGDEDRARRERLQEGLENEIFGSHRLGHGEA